MFQAVLTYTLSVGYQPLIPTRNRVVSLPLHVEETAGALGFDVAGDVTAVVGRTVRREITLQTNALGDRLWTTAAQVEAITRRLFGPSLSVQTPTVVVSDAPVVT